MKEVISVNVGQAGIQLGSAIWELFSCEHGVSPNGLLTSDQAQTNELTQTFFSIDSSGKHVPRAVFIDTDRNATDALLAGPYGDLVDSESVVGWNYNCSSLFSKGRLCVPSELVDKYLSAIRKKAEDCNDLDGFLIFNSTSGGTGGGLTSKLIEALTQEYTSQVVVDFPIFPSPRLSNAITDFYNVPLAVSRLMKSTDASVVLDNSAIEKVCKQHCGIESPTFADLNAVTAYLVSSMTSSIRFGGSASHSLADFVRSTVPSPRFNLLLSSYSPFAPNLQALEANSMEELTNLAFEQSSMFADVAADQGKYLTCLLTYRGEVSDSEAEASIVAIKAKPTVSFPDWATPKYSCCISLKAPGKVPTSRLISGPRAVAMLSSSTAIAEKIKSINSKFYLTYARRAYVHFYVASGMEELDFIEAREDLAILEDEYASVEVGRT